ELFVEQPQGNVAFTKEEPKAEAIGITSNELMQKAIMAAGGEANIRKHNSLELRYTVKIETQGVDGDGRMSMAAPNCHADEVVLRGAGKEIARLREYFDGSGGGAERSFGGSSVLKGAALVDAAAEADFYALLNWRK